MCGSAPAPAPVPATPTKSDAEVQAEADAERRRILQQGGRSMTILTGGLGDPGYSSAPKQSATLLGQTGA